MLLYTLAADLPPSTLILVRERDRKEERKRVRVRGKGEKGELNREKRIEINS